MVFHFTYLISEDAIYNISRKFAIIFLPLKTWKTHPQKLINGPQFFSVFPTGPNPAQIHKSVFLCDFYIMTLYKGHNGPSPINSNWLSLALLEVTGRCQNMVIFHYVLCFWVCYLDFFLLITFETYPFFYLWTYFLVF